MFRVILIGLFSLFASLANAGELNDSYSEMGRMSAQIGDQTFELVIPFDLEEEFGYAEQKLIMGSFLTINTAGRLVDDAGEPSGPTLQITLQKQGGELQLLSAELFDEQGFDAPMAMGADGGPGELVSHSFENDVLTAEVRGSFVRLTGYRTGEPKPADGASPQETVITWQVTLPPLE